MCVDVQVDYVDKSRNQVALKMLPRVDYTRKRGALKGAADDASRKRKRGRPPAKLFDQEAIKSVWRETENDVGVRAGGRGKVALSSDCAL